MTRIERYVLRTAATAFLTGLVVLTGVIWITQALRQIDLLTSKGQTILIFLMMTGLALPSLVAVIAPVALFAGVLYTLNKLNGDSELVVMAAAGVSPARLLRPLALLSVAVFAIVAAIYVQLLPWSFGAIENLTTFVRADFISNFARPGAFSNLRLGFVFHYRERTPDGALRGVFMQDRRDPAHVSTYIAEAGKTFEKDGVELPSADERRSAAPAIGGRFGDGDVRRLHDRPVPVRPGGQRGQAAARAQHGGTDGARAPRTRPTRPWRVTSAANCSIASPARFTRLVAGLIAFAALGEARTTRQGRGLAIGGAILAFVVVRMLGIAATTLTVGVPSAAFFVWAIPDRAPSSAPWR